MLGADDRTAATLAGEGRGQVALFSAERRVERAPGLKATR